MSEKDNAKDYERIIKLEDDIYDSDILENYDVFILNCIKFAEENIIPLSKYSNELDDILKKCVAFLENKISKAELEKYYCELGKKIVCQVF